LSLYGYTTKRDLQFLSTFFIGALFGLIAMMILSMFMHSTGFDLLIAGAGVLLFAGLIAFDTQKLKLEYGNRAFGSMAKAQIWGALDLYLDFLNMFLFLLRFLGVSKDD
jgi:FtsH-binding integral membrane protein